MLTTLILFIVASGVPQAPAKADDGKVAEARKLAKADLNKMQGTWLRVKMEVEGKDFELEGKWTATYEQDVLTLSQDGKPYLSGSIVTLDPSSSPKAMNTWNKEGTDKDKTWSGIYHIDGDTMKVCFSPPGKDRPNEFTTKNGPGYLYTEYKRQKP